MLLKVVYDTEHADANALPCVLLLSGADCPHEAYMWLASRLAKAGCAVALSSCVVPFGPGSCLLSTPFDLSALGSLEAYKRNPARAGLEALRAALAELETPRLDLGRLAVGGHSSGGRTALDVAAFETGAALGVRAVFCYGASLVNSGMGSFAPRGSVLPCDAEAPPPLLLLGGSEDGVSAALSDAVRTTHAAHAALAMHSRRPSSSHAHAPSLPCVASLCRAIPPPGRRDGDAAPHAVRGRRARQRRRRALRPRGGKPHGLLLARRSVLRRRTHRPTAEASARHGRRRDGARPTRTFRSGRGQNGDAAETDSRSCGPAPQRALLSVLIVDFLHAHGLTKVCLHQPPG